MHSREYPEKHQVSFLNNEELTLSRHQTSLGEMLIGYTNKGLAVFDFAHRRNLPRILQAIQKWYQADLVEENDRRTSVILTQLDEYLEGRRKAFEIELDLRGSDFQLAVWNALLTIPYGETYSYQELANRIGQPSARAVGQANGANHLAIIVPCHRVVNQDGSLQGYAGGIPLKKRLLSLEKKYSSSSLESFFE